MIKTFWPSCDEIYWSPTKCDSLKWITQRIIWSSYEFLGIVAVLTANLITSFGRVMFWMQYELKISSVTCKSWAISMINSVLWLFDHKIFMRKPFLEISNYKIFIHVALKCFYNATMWKQSDLRGWTFLHFVRSPMFSLKTKKLNLNRSAIF